ncbi:MAG: hypothetical protein GY854_09115 [Deltaproteobacteria bacterium]|nr:hypothetical protein [Deltaproteobacteria bacterium]
MKKLLAKPILWLLTSAIPVFIAACYGMPMYLFNAKGRVVDKKTGEGINNIKVSCIMTNGPITWPVGESFSSTTVPDGGMWIDDETFSQPGDGYFYIGYDDPCYEIRFEDVDGEQNGGSYATQTILMTEDGDADLTVEMEPVD